MQQHSEVTDHTNPPFEAELIAAVVANPDLYWEILDYLPASPSDAFYFLSGKWYAIADAIEAGNPIPNVDGQAAPADDALATARQLGELYQRRVLAELSQDVLRRLRDGESVPNLVAAQEEGLAKVQEAIAASRPGQLLWGDALVTTVLGYAQEAKEARESGRETLGVPTGHVGLDRIINGLLPGLLVVGGAPGVGKTTLALQWACNAAQDGTPVVYCTYENSPMNLVLKAVCRLGGVSPTDVDRGRADLGRLQEGARLFGGIAPRMAFLEGNARTSVSYIQGRARQAMARHGAIRCLVVVDYLQRMAHGGQYGNLRENVSSLTLGLRELATRLDSPVLAISSLSRGANNYDHPTLESLKESGDIEFSSDLVLLLGARQDAIGNRGCRPMDLLVAKNRFGEADKKIPMVFKPALGDFLEEAKQ